LSKPYDATSKDLIETDPAGWVTFLGCPVAPSAVRLVDADVSTVTTDADKVIRVDGPAPWLLHLDIQTSWEEAMDRRVLRYNALLHQRHALPVASVVVILRSAASMSALTGVLPVRPPVGPGWEFRYEVVRVWDRPAADFLSGPLGLLPLAPLAKLQPPDLPAVVAAMRARIDGQPDRPLAAKLWAASYVLMGLRYDRALIDNLLSGVMQMEESVTYQAILSRGMQQGIEQGQIDEARATLLRLGRTKFGPPTAEQEAAVNAITDLARLRALSEKLLDVSTWDELLKQD
jgi:predicted transposase YdaD